MILSGLNIYILIVNKVSVWYLIYGFICIFFTWSNVIFVKIFDVIAAYDWDKSCDDIWKCYNDIERFHTDDLLQWNCYCRIYQVNDKR